MRKHLGNFALGLGLVCATFVASEAGARRYTGTEVKNLRDTINAQSAVLVQTQANISALTHLLDADSGVNTSTYSTQIALITTASETLTGN